MSPSPIKVFDEDAFRNRSRRANQRFSIGSTLMEWQSHIERADECEKQIATLRADVEKRQREFDQIPRAAVGGGVERAKTALLKARSALEIAERGWPALRDMRESAERQIPELEAQLAALDAE